MEHLNSVEHLNADVAVLGTGGAGKAGAITAAEGGAKVIVLKKGLFQAEHPILRSTLVMLLQPDVSPVNPLWTI